MKTKNLFIALISMLFAFQACTTDDVSLTETGPGDWTNLYAIKDNAFGEYLKYLKVSGVYSQVSNESGNAVISYVIDTVESQGYTGEINLNKSNSSMTKLETAGLTTAKEKIKDLDGIQYFPGATSLILTSNELTSINLSKSVNLTLLNLNNNWIGSLDLSQNTKLKTLLYNASSSASAPENSKLIEIDLTHNVELDTISMTNHELKNIDLSQNTKLRGVNFKGNSNTLYIPQEVYDRLNTATGLQPSKEPEIPGEGDYYTIPDKAFGEFLHYRLKDQGIVAEENGTYKIDKTKAAAYTGELDLTKSKSAITELTEAGLETAETKLTDLSGIEYFTGITSLKLVSNQVTSLDITKLVNLTYLDLNANWIGSLDLTKNTKLEYLRYGASSSKDAPENSKLSNLDLTQNTVLTTILLSGHLLNDLDLSKNTKLTVIDLSKNPGVPFVVSSEVYDNVAAEGNKNTVIDSIKK